MACIRGANCDEPVSCSNLVSEDTFNAPDDVPNMGAMSKNESNQAADVTGDNGNLIHSSSKNGIIASAIDKQDTICLSFKSGRLQGQKANTESLNNPQSEHSMIRPTALRDSKLHSDSNGIASSSQKDITIEIKSPNLFKNITDTLIMDGERTPDRDCSASTPVKEDIIDGFSILSFKTREDLVSYAAKFESKNQISQSMVEDTGRRSRKSGLTKRKRTKTHVKHTLSQTSTPDSVGPHDLISCKKEPTPSSQNSVLENGYLPCSYTPNQVTSHSNLDPRNHSDTSSHHNFSLNNTRIPDNRVTNSTDPLLLNTSISPSPTDEDDDDEDNNNTNANGHSYLKRINSNHRHHDRHRHRNHSRHRHRHHSHVRKLSNSQSSQNSETSSSTNLGPSVSQTKNAKDFYLRDHTNDHKVKNDQGSPDSCGRPENDHLSLTPGSNRRWDTRTKYEHNLSPHNSRTFDFVCDRSPSPKQSPKPDPVPKLEQSTHKPARSHLFSVAALTDESPPTHQQTISNSTTSPIIDSEHQLNRTTLKPHACGRIKGSRQSEPCTDFPYTTELNSPSSTPSSSQNYRNRNALPASAHFNNLNSPEFVPGYPNHSTTAMHLLGAQRVPSRAPNEFSHEIFPEAQFNSFLSSLLPSASPNLPGHVLGPRLPGTGGDDSLPFPRIPFASDGLPNHSLALTNGFYANLPFPHPSILRRFMGLSPEAAHRLLYDPRFAEFYNMSMASLSNSGVSSPSTCTTVAGSSDTSAMIITDAVGKSCANSQSSLVMKTCTATGTPATVSKATPGNMDALVSGGNASDMTSTNKHSSNPNGSMPHKIEGSDNAFITQFYSQSAHSGTISQSSPIGKITSPIFLNMQQQHQAAMPTPTSTPSTTSSLSGPGIRCSTPNTVANPQLLRSQAVLATAYADRECLSSPTYPKTRLNRPAMASQSPATCLSSSSSSGQPNTVQPLPNSHLPPSDRMMINPAMGGMGHEFDILNRLPVSVGSSPTAMSHHLNRLGAPHPNRSSTGMPMDGNMAALHPGGVRSHYDREMFQKQWDPHMHKMVNGDHMIGERKSLDQNNKLPPPPPLLAAGGLGLFHPDHHNLRPNTMPISPSVIPPGPLRPSYPSLPGRSHFPADPFSHFQAASSRQSAKSMRPHIAQTLSSCSLSSPMPLTSSNSLGRNGRGSLSLLFRPAHKDMACGRWADAHIRIAKYIHHCTIVTSRRSHQHQQQQQLAQSSHRDSISSIMHPNFPNARLPIRPSANRSYSTIPQPALTEMFGPMSLRCRNPLMDSGLYRGSAPPGPMPPPPSHPLAPSAHPSSCLPSGTSGMPADINLLGHLFTEFMSSLSSEFSPGLPLGGDIRSSMLNKLYGNLVPPPNSQTQTTAQHHQQQLPQVQRHPTAMYPTLNPSSMPTDLSLSGCVQSVKQNPPPYPQPNLNLPFNHLANPFGLPPTHPSSSCSNFPNPSHTSGTLSATSDSKRRRTENLGLDHGSNLLAGLPFPNRLSGMSASSYPRPTGLVPPSGPHTDVLAAASHLLNSYRSSDLLAGPKLQTHPHALSHPHSHSQRPMHQQQHPPTPSADPSRNPSKSSTSIGSSQSHPLSIRPW